MSESTEKLPFIIAVDFDGTLVTDKFPEIGDKDKMLFTVCNLWKEAGAKLILWTCRHGEALIKAIDFCNRNGLYFDAINENIPEVQALYGTDTRKVYADVYIDDKAVMPDTYMDAISRRLGSAIRKPDYKRYY